VVRNTFYLILEILIPTEKMSQLGTNQPVIRDEVHRFTPGGFGVELRSVIHHLREANRTPRVHLLSATNRSQTDLEQLMSSLRSSSAQIKTITSGQYAQLQNIVREDVVPTGIQILTEDGRKFLLPNPDYVPTFDDQKKEFARPLRYFPEAEAYHQFKYWEMEHTGVNQASMNRLQFRQFLQSL
jgi:hypothetical protein